MSGGTAWLLLSVSISLLCVLWIQITTAHLLIMATDDDHDMTAAAAGSASPRDEGMHDGEAEPTIQEQLSLDMELLRSEGNLPSALISVLAGLVDANKALNEQNAELMAEVDAQRKEIARLEKGITTPSRTIAYAPSMPTPNLDKFTGTQDPKSWIKVLENLFKQHPMFAQSKSRWVPFALSHCSSAVCDMWEQWLKKNPPAGGDDTHWGCFAKFMRETYSAQESDASIKARIKNLRFKSSVPPALALQDYILKFDELLGKLKEQLPDKEQISLFVENLPTNLRKGCKAMAYAVPTRDLAQVKVNAKAVIENTELYGDDDDEPEQARTRSDDRSRPQQRKHSPVQRTNSQQQNASRGNGPQHGRKRPFGPAPARFPEACRICGLRNHTTEKCFKRPREQRENNNGAGTSSRPGHQGNGRPR